MVGSYFHISPTNMKMETENLFAQQYANPRCTFNVHTQYLTKRRLQNRFFYSLQNLPLLSDVRRDKSRIQHSIYERRDLCRGFMMQIKKDHFNRYKYFIGDTISRYYAVIAIFYFCMLIALYYIILYIFIFLNIFRMQ